MASGLPEKMSVTMVLAAIRRLQGLSGLLTRFPFNHYALILPEAAEGGSKPIAGAKVL